MTARRYPGLEVDEMGRPYLNGERATDDQVLARFPELVAADLWDVYQRDDIPMRIVRHPPINQPKPSPTVAPQEAPTGEDALAMVPHTPQKQSIGAAVYGDERAILLGAHDRLNRMEGVLGDEGGSLQINHSTPEERMDKVERLLEDRSLRALNLIAKVGNKLIQGQGGTDMVVADSKAFYGQMLELAKESIREHGNWLEGYEQGYADALKEAAPSTMSLRERAANAWNMLRGKDGNAEKVQA